MRRENGGMSACRLGVPRSAHLIETVCPRQGESFQPSGGNRGLDGTKNTRISFLG